jgi:hypothetical protein
MASFAYVPRVKNALHFILRFSFDDVWGWSWEVGPVFLGFVIRGQQVCVEHVVDMLLLPLGW